MKNILTLARREMAQAFNSPLAYIVLGVFLAVAGWKFYYFPGVFLMGKASFRGFFDWMPTFLAVLAPAMTMRSLAEEKKTGTLEGLMTMPVKETDVVMGKWLGALAVIAVGLLFSTGFVFSIAMFVAKGQSFDWGPVFGGYIGSLLLASTFVAIGILTSALTKNQVIAFIVALATCAMLCLLSFVIFILPASLGEPIQYLSAYYHFESLGRGVVDFRDVLYFVTTTAAALWLAVRVLQGMRRAGADVSGSAATLLILGSLVLVNLIAEKLPARLDLTRDKLFTLSPATKDTLDAMKSPVTITAYFSKDLPPPFSDNARYVRDLLEEYRAKAGSNLSFSFVDPEASETEADKDKKKDVKQDIFGRILREKTSVETELEGLGIQPVEIRVLEDDQQQQKRAYMGISVRYGEKKEALPVVQDMSSLEYDLTTMVRRLTREKDPVVGVLQGHGEPNPDEALAKLKQLLDPNYDLKPITLSNTADAKIDDEVAALLVIGPTEALGDNDLKAIDDHLMKGKSAAFFVDVAQVDLRTFQPTPSAHNLGDLLSTYGIELGSQLVGDVECASLSVQEKRGFLVMNVPVKYPFIPALRKLEGESMLAKGLSDISVPFAMPLYAKTVDGVRVDVLAKSSGKAWLEDASAEGLSPKRDWGQANVAFTGPYNLMMTATGKLPSKFNAGTTAASEARVFVAGSSTMLNEQVLGPPNAALFMNTIDWMVLDANMLAMRTRQAGEAPLEPDVSDTTKSATKALNVIGIPLLLIAYGVVRWRMREGKRQRLAVAA
jgi:gliding-associated putative ABC transporter substrate-binding component GldG